MSRRWFEVKSGWLTDQGRRLEAPAYAEGGLTARDNIKAGPWPWCHLSKVARIFSASRFARVYVSDPRRGVPYLTGSDMLLSDLSGLLFLSTRRTPQLARLGVERNWILMSCSGTVGRTVFVREDMADMALSHDVIRIVSNRSRVLPGYLFAFLTSAPAQAMIRQQTYGSVVQHIEPHHLADLPVPLPEAPQQRHIHELVDSAARARTEARRLLDEASSHFDTLAVGRLKHTYDHALAVGLVRRSSLQGSRLDAFFHSGWAAEAKLDGDPLGSFAEVHVPGRMKLVAAENGYEFLTGVDVYQVRPVGTKRIATWLPGVNELRVRSGQILMQVDGQRYGLLGRPAASGRRLDGKAVSWHLARITCDEPGRVFAFASSEVGRRAIVRSSYGTSVPAISATWLRRIRVPSLPGHLVQNANRALQLREQADADEELAIREVEAWLG